MTQAKLTEISGEEGGSADDEDESPGVDPTERSLLPRKFDHNQEVEEDGDDEGDEELPPVLRGRRVHGPCPICGNLSTVSWRCVDCGKLFDDVRTKGRDADTAVGG